ncbi:hypothetical protein Tco_0407865 [Tanacetum coccineum]
MDEQAICLLLKEQSDALHAELHVQIVALTADLQAAKMVFKPTLRRKLLVSKPVSLSDAFYLARVTEARLEDQSSPLLSSKTISATTQGIPRSLRLGYHGNRQGAYTD